ncbi:MAG TPA: discoidin domain-containing protein [Polyangiaceae bacterium]
MFNLTAAQKIAWTLLGTLSLAAYACGDDDVIVRPPTTSTTTASGGAGGSSSTSTSSTTTSASGGQGGTSGEGGAGGSNAGSGGTAGGGGNGGGATDAGRDASTDVAITDAKIGDVVNGTPDGGAYARTGWTATSVPPYATGALAYNQDLKYPNAFDGRLDTRWSIGNTHIAATGYAQMVGDQFTLDMKVAHTFGKIVFWAGSSDARDYPGALDAFVSNDGVDFSTKVGSGTESQPGCDNATCTMPFTISLTQKATARYVRLVLTQRCKLCTQTNGVSGLWWGIGELYVYP